MLSVWLLHRPVSKRTNIGALPHRRLHSEGSQCMAGYPLLGEVPGELPHTYSLSPQLDWDVCCLFCILIIQGSHHLHLSLSMSSFKLTFKKKHLFIYICTYVPIKGVLWHPCGGRKTICGNRFLPPLRGFMEIELG